MKQPNIVIIDYGIGNTHSVSNAIKYLGYKKLKISAEENVISKADVIILPGVGAFDEAVKNLRKRNLDKILDEQVLVNKKSILGVCLGMQLLASFSEENGIHTGLNWIEGRVEKLILSEEYSVPHVGWNNVSIVHHNNLFSRNESGCHFYFDHSYHYVCNDQYKLATCNYGIEITSAINKENIFGVQFHPEKSQTNGLKLFRGFFNTVL